jgi:hypothetical protein
MELAFGGCPEIKAMDPGADSQQTVERADPDGAASPHQVSGH